MTTPFRVKSLFEYSSPHEDDLNFGNGQIITVTEEEDADWYSGEYHDDAGVKHEGIFPRNFVEKFEPQAPPRPVRTRTKREPEATQRVEKTEAAPPPPPAQEETAPDLGPEPEIEEAHEPVHKPTHTEPQAPAASEHAPRKSLDSAPAHAPVPSAPKVSEPVVTSPAPAPGPSQAPKPRGPPPVSDKPKSSSFKDRIAAFNKPAAPPVAPFKPSGLTGSGSGFIKKPFVAPPPSRHAFIPPPQQAPTAKIYRRDEDPEIKEREAEVQGQAEKAGLVPHESQEGEEEDQPKPTSLKERIALLQKQQMEQAQRHAEAATKKEKPKKPVKKRESISHAEGLTEGEEAQPPPLERRDTEESGPRTSVDEPRPARMPPPPRRKSSKGPPVEPIHDGNEADMSGAGDTTDNNDDLTEREDSDGISRRPSKAPTMPIQPSVAPEPAKRPESDEEEEQEAEEEDENVDPEVKRKEELRARMAKMSGGMGFHGMFGAPAPAASAPAKKKKAPKAEQSPVDEEEEEEEQKSPASRAAPPIPTMMALPGMGGPRMSAESTRTVEQQEQATRGPPPPLPTRQVDEEAEEESEEEGETTPAPTAPPNGMYPQGAITFNILMISQPLHEMFLHLRFLVVVQHLHQFPQRVSQELIEGIS